MMFPHVIFYSTCILQGCYFVPISLIFWSVGQVRNLPHQCYETFVCSAEQSDHEIPDLEVHSKPLHPTLIFTKISNTKVFFSFGYRLRTKAIKHTIKSHLQ